MRDVWIGDRFDDQLRDLIYEPDIALHLSGSLKTKGVYRWGQYASRNLGQNWTVDGDAEISLDPSAITDVDSQPLFCLAGPAKRVSGIRTRGNHSILAREWSGSLRTGSVVLEGDGTIDGLTFSDFGSLGAETFVAVVTDGDGFTSITNTVFTDFHPLSSDTQVSVRLITAADVPVAIHRSDCLMEGNKTFASGSNWVQAHTIYQAKKGLIRKNQSIGARTGYYGDYWSTKGITIEENEFLGCEHGVELKLSPTAGDDTELPKYFSHEDYTIGLNKIESSGANVSISTIGPPTETRFIRGIKIHASLSVENFGGEISRFGEDLNARKGCNPFRRS